MIRIIDKRSSGKTSRLLLLAQEYNGIVVCANSSAMEQKARSYGFYDIRCEDYYWLISQGNRGNNQPIFIDELDNFLKYLGNIQGYDLSIED